MKISNGVNKKIPFPIAIIIIMVLAVLVGGLAVWQYFNILEVKVSEIIPPKKTAPKIELEVSEVIPVEETSFLKIIVSEAIPPEEKGEDRINERCEYKKGECELRVYDSQGRVTGLVNGEVKMEIPRSYYFHEYTIETQEGTEHVPQEVLIFDPQDLYVYETFGLTERNYKFVTSYAQEGKEFTFYANNIPLLPGETHQYHFDWDALIQGKDGVTIFIDANKDRVFEKTINPDLVFSEVSGEEFIVLTCEEFISKLGVSP